MSQGRRSLGVTASVVVFALCLVFAGVIVWRTDDLATRLAGVPAARWRAGVSAADLAVMALPVDNAQVPKPERLAAVLEPLLASSALGSHVTAHIMDISTGQALAGQDQDSPTVPASTIKLVTAAAALTSLGTTHRFTTKAVAGDNPGEVVLVGGGDPTLAAGAVGSYPDAARLSDLAAQAKRALGGTAATKVVYDTSIFEGPLFGPWDTDIPTGGNVAAITGLISDGGRVDPTKNKGEAERHSDPGRAAARAFAAALGLPASAVVKGTAAAGAKELGSVQSPPLARQVEMMLTESDNVIAETLARHVAIKRGKPATFEGAAAAEKEVIGELGLPLTELEQADGSGLARGNKVSPSLLAQIVALGARADHPELRPILTGLPVSAYNGTLSTRFRKSNASAPGTVRAKTGTLRAVSGIAGVVTTADGRLLAFAVLADNVPVGGTIASQDALDRVVTAVAACGCR